MEKTKVTTKELIGRYKYLLAGITTLLIFFSVRSCVNKQSAMLAGIISNQKEQIAKLEDGVKVSENDRLRIKDSARLEDIKAQKYIASLQDRIKNSENKVNSLETDAKKAKEKVKNLSYSESAKEFNEIYKTNNAEALTTGVNLKNNLPNLVLETVVGANYAQDIIKEKNTQLFAKDSIILNKDSQLKNSSLVLQATEKSLKDNQELNKLQKEFSKNLEKENKKLKQKNTLNKILVPAAAVLGIIIGVKTSGK